MSRLARAVAWLLAAGVALAVVVWIAFRVSPWPGAFLIRRAFEKGALAANQALARHVPPGVVDSVIGERYDPADADALLDVYYPAEAARAGRALPTIVWVHGGGWVSGTRADIGNYARVLAARGYTVVSVDYSIAPGATYPTPLLQVNAALGYLIRNAARLHIDPDHLVLAGDSGGAHVVSGVAAGLTDAAYARAVGFAPAVEPRRLRGMLLFCGAYDIGAVNLEGSFGGFLRTVLWSYSGRKDWTGDERFGTASVVNYVTPAFPPSFISAGNGDPLLPQSRAMAAALAAQGVRVDSLFFPADYTPSLPHEYQFNLDTDAGRQALERAVRFLASLEGSHGR
jgi:acetyl esterase/lipase